MKTTIKAKVVVEYDKDKMAGDINLEKIRTFINNGHYVVEWINSELSHEQEPTLIIKI